MVEKARQQEHAAAGHKQRVLDASSSSISLFYLVHDSSPWDAVAYMHVGSSHIKLT